MLASGCVARAPEVHTCVYSERCGLVTERRGGRAPTRRNLAPCLWCVSVHSASIPPTDGAGDEHKCHSRFSITTSDFSFVLACSTQRDARGRGRVTASETPP